MEAQVCLDCKRFRHNPHYLWRKGSTLQLLVEQCSRYLQVALYCAFLHCYFFFLSVPAILGFATWLNLGAFSITYGSLLSLWSIVFVEYWKIREADLSLRWGVKGLQQLKENRADNPKERHPRSSGTVGAILPGKQVLTQMLLALFALIASVVVGSSVCPTLAGEALLFGQPVQQYVWLLPTILFSLLQPLAADLLSWAAAWLLSYDNHRSQASYGFVLFPRTVLLEFITSLLPTIVSAYVYLPFNKPNIPFLVMLTHSGLDLDQPRGHGEFDMNILRLQTTVLFFSRPVQAPNIWKRTIWPFTKREVRHTYLPRGVDSDSQATRVSQINSSNEEVFLRRVCNEAEAEEYDVDNNILRKAVQYGYMIMFSVISPAVPLVMFFSAWLELRGLFSNLTKNYQRPPPARAESIGPYLQALEVLSQMGTISTAVVIQLVRNPPTNIDLLSLLLTMLIAHQLHLAARLAVSAMLQKLLIDPLTQESTLLYNARKKFLETTLYHSSPGSPGTRARRRVRFNERVNVYNSSVTPSSSSDSGSPSPDSEQPHDEVLKGSDRESEFWNWGSGDPSADGVELIKTFGGSEDTIRRKVMKATMIF